MRRRRGLYRAPMTRKVLLDACVLFPSLVRGILIGIAERGLFAPVWSERIFGEWRIAVARQHGLDAEAEVVMAQADLTQRFPDASVEAWPEFEIQIHLPDPADAHVLGAAIAGGADILLTFNLKDFPRRIVEPLGIEVQHPDGYLWSLLGEVPNMVNVAATHALDTAGIAPERRRAALKRAKLPRFAKALEALPKR